MSHSCEDCKWWDAVTKISTVKEWRTFAEGMIGSVGVCKFGPPTASIDDVMIYKTDKGDVAAGAAYWPTTTSDEFCGCWSPRDDDR